MLPFGFRRIGDSNIGSRHLRCERSLATRRSLYLVERSAVFWDRHNRLQVPKSSRVSIHYFISTESKNEGVISLETKFVRSLLAKVKFASRLGLFCAGNWISLI